MGFREVSVVEVREVLRAWLEGRGAAEGRRAGGGRPQDGPPLCGGGPGRGTVPRGRCRAAVTDELIGRVVEAVRPVRPTGHGAAWETLLELEEQIRAWVAAGVGSSTDLTVVKIEELLARQGVRVPYRTLHRFAVERCGFRTGEAPRCGSPTVSPGWSARSTSLSSGC